MFNCSLKDLDTILEKIEEYFLFESDINLKDLELSIQEELKDFSFAEATHIEEIMQALVENGVNIEGLVKSSSSIHVPTKSNVIKKITNYDVKTIFAGDTTAYNYFEGYVNSLMRTYALIGVNTETFINSDEMLSNSMQDLKEHLFSELQSFLHSKGILKTEPIPLFDENGNVANYGYYSEIMTMATDYFYSGDNVNLKTISGKNVPDLSIDLISNNSLFDAYNNLIFLNNFDTLVKFQFGNMIDVNYEFFNHLSSVIGSIPKYKRSDKANGLLYWNQDTHDANSSESKESKITKMLVESIPMYDSANNLTPYNMEMKDMYLFSSMIHDFELKFGNKLKNSNPNFKYFNKSSPDQLKWYLEEILKAIKRDNGFIEDFTKSIKLNNEEGYSFKNIANIIYSLDNFLNDPKLNILEKAELNANPIVTMLTQVINNNYGATYSVFNSRSGLLLQSMYQQDFNNTAMNDTVISFLELNQSNKELFNLKNKEERLEFNKLFAGYELNDNLYTVSINNQNVAKKFIDYINSKTGLNLGYGVFLNILSDITQRKGYENISARQFKNVLETFINTFNSDFKLDSSPFRKSYLTSAFDMSASEILPNVLKDPLYNSIITSQRNHMTDIMMKPVMNVEASDGNKVPSFKTTTLTFKDTELFDQQRNFQNKEGNVYKSLLLGDVPAILGTSAKLDVFNPNTEKSKKAVKMTPTESFISDFKQEFWDSILRNDTFQIVLGNYSDKNTVFTKIINTKFALADSKTTILKESIEDLLKAVRTQSANYYADTFKQVFEDYKGLFEALGFEHASRMNDDFENNVSVINEVLANNNILDLLDQYSKSEDYGSSMKPKFNIVDELHYSRYADGMAINQLLADNYRIYNDEKLFNEFVKRQEQSFLGKYGEIVGNYDLSKVVNAEAGKFNAILEALNIDKDTLGDEKTEMVLGNGDLNPIIKKWMWANALFRNEYIFMTAKGEYMHPHKNGSKYRSGEFNEDYWDNFDLEMSGRLDSMAKRNVIFTASIETPNRNSKYGTPDNVNVAAIEDFKSLVFTSTGYDTDQDVHDGSSFIDDTYNRMLEASYPGKGYSGTKKQFGTLITSHAVAIKKDAESVITNNLIRNSSGSNISMFIKKKQMLSLPIKSVLNTDESITFNNLFYFDRGNTISIDSVKFKNVDGQNTMILKTSTKTDNGWVFNKDNVVEINTLFDIWQAFGGIDSTDSNGNFNEGSNEALYKIVTEVGDGALKNDMIHILSNKSALKAGNSNLNKRSKWNEDAPLLYSTFENRFMGPQLDASHGIDNSEIKEITQLISSLSQGGFTTELATEIYQSIARVVELSAKKYVDGMNKNDPALYHFLTDKFIKSVQNAKGDVLAKSLIHSLKEDKLRIPFSNASFFTLFVRDLITNLNNEFISRNYTGIGSVLLPSHGIIQLYDRVMPDGRILTMTQQDLMKEAYQNYDESVFVKKYNRLPNNNEEILNLYKEYLFPNTKIDLDQVQIGDTILVDGIQEKINTPEEYYKFKNSHAGKPLEKVWSVPRDLKSTNYTFEYDYNINENPNEFKLLNNTDSLNLSPNDWDNIYNNYVALMDRKREGEALNKDLFLYAVKDKAVYNSGDTYIFGEWDANNLVFKGRFLSAPSPIQLFKAFSNIVNNVDLAASVPVDIGNQLERLGMYKIDVTKIHNFRGADMEKNLYVNSQETAERIFNKPVDQITVEDIDNYDVYYNKKRILDNLKEIYFDVINSGNLKNAQLMYPLIKELGVYDYNAYKLSKRALRTNLNDKAQAQEIANSVMDLINHNSRKILVNIDKNDTLNDIRIYENFDNELNKTLATYLSKFGIKTQMLEDLQASLGIDAMAHIDILNKILYVNETDQTTYPEQAGKIIAFMMQQNPLVSEIISSMKRLNTFGNPETKTKEEYLEDVGRLIADELHKRYEIPAPKSLREKIIELKNKFLDMINRTRLKRINRNVATIVDNVMIQNQALITATPHKPGSYGKTQKVSLESALQESDFAKSVVDDLSDYFILTGSVTLSENGTIYRPEGNLVHDLDWKSPLPREISVKILNELFPGNQYVRSIENKSDGYYTDTWIVPPRGYKIANAKFKGKNNSKLLGYDIVNESGEVVSQFIPETESHTGEIEAVIVDIFSYIDAVRDSKAKNYSTYTLDSGKLLKIANWQDTFEAKIKFSRIKDLWDYNRFIPNENLNRPISGNIFDLNSVKTLYHLKDLYNQIKNKKEIIITPEIENLSRFADYLTNLNNEKNNKNSQFNFIDYISNLEEHTETSNIIFKNLETNIRRWMQREYQLLQHGYVSPQRISNYSEYFEHDNLISNIDDVLQVYKNKSVRVKNVNFSAAEKILGDLYQTNFKRDSNDSMYEINKKGHEYFKEKLNDYYVEDDTEADLKIISTKSDSPIYVKFVEELPLLDTNYNISQEITGTDNLRSSYVRYNEIGEKIYSFGDPKYTRVSSDENGNETIYIKLGKTYTEKGVTRWHTDIKGFEENVKNIIKSFGGSLQALIPLYNNQDTTLEYYTYAEGPKNKKVYIPGNYYDLGNFTLSLFTKHLQIPNKYFVEDIDWFYNNKEKILDQLARQNYASWQKSHDLIDSRIPGQSMQSFMPMRNVAYMNTKTNDSYVSINEIFLQGSDFDIDKAYTLGYSFNSNGLIEAPSQLSNYSTLEQLNALEQLPIANRRNLEVNNFGTDVTSYLEQLSDDYIINNEFTAEDIKVLDGLIRHISSNKITFVTSDPKRERELRFVVRAIQRHNNPQLTMSDSEALKNNIVSKIHQIISNPSNQTWANTPVSVSDWHEAIKKVNERRSQEELADGQETYKGLVIVEDSNLQRSDGSANIASVDLKNNQILLNRDLAKQRFNEKSWINETRKNNLSENQFKTYEQFEDFILENAYQRSLYPKDQFIKDFPNKTLVEYEEEINNRALKELDLIKVNPADIPNMLNSNPTVLNEDTGYYVHEWGEVEAGEYTNYERQSTFKTRVLYPGVTETTSPIMERAAKFGDFIDEIGRNVFEGNISSNNLKLVNTIFSNWEKSQNITRFKDIETLQTIVKSVVSQMEQVRNDLIKKGYQFETKGVKVWGKFSQKGRENFNRDSKQDDKEHTSGIAGTLDIVAYDKSGNIIIIDFKSFKANSAYGLDYALSNLLDSKGKYKSRMSGYAEQQEIYKLLLENEHNVKVEDLYAFVIPYSMTEDGTVIANHSLDDLAKAYKNSKNPIKLPVSNKHSSGLLNLKGYAGEKYKSASGATGRDAFLNAIKFNLELKGKDRSASKIIKDSQKRVNSNKKNLLSSYDMFSYYQQQYNASVGKDDVGIAANGIKVFYALSNYFNNYYKQGDFDTNILTNRKMFNKTLEFVKNGIPTNYSGTYTTIADVQIPNQALNDLQAINSNFMQRFVDAANNLSSFLSAATDNAKELIMAQVNASTDLAAMHIYLMILGLNVEQVVEIMTDPIMTSIVKNMENNIFTNDKVQTFLQITKNLKKEYSANKDWDNVKNIETYEAIFRGGQEITSLSSLLGVNQKRTADTWELYDYLDKFRNLITTTENKFYTFSKFDKTGLNHINENNYQKILTIVANKISIDKGYTALNPDGSVVGDPEIVDEILGTLYRAYRLDIMNGNFDFEKYFSDPEYKEVSKNYYNLIKETFNVLDVVDEVAHFQSMIGSLDLFHNILKKYVTKYKYVFNEFREVNKNTYSTDKKLTRGIAYFDTKAREHWFKSGDMLNFAFKVKDLMRLAGVDKFSMYTSSQAKNNRIKNEHTLEVELKDSSDPIIDLQTNEGIANFKRAFEQLMFPVIQQGLGKDNFLKLDKILSQFGEKMVAVTPNVSLSSSKVPMLLKRFQETLRTFDNLDAKMGIEYQVKNSIQEYVKWKDILFVYNLIVNNERYGNKRLTPLFENYSKDKSTLGYNYSKFWSQIDEGMIDILDGTTLEDIEFFSENKKGSYLEKGIYGDNTDFVIITNTTESETDKVYNKDIADVLKMLKEGGFIITLKC